VRRPSIPYGENAVRAVAVAGAVDVETPVAGFFRIRLGAGTIAVGVRIFNGPPADPVTGERLDRSYRWQAIADDGELLDWDRVWPACAKNPITEADFKARQARRTWAEQAAPDSSYANRKRRYDPLSSTEVLPF
jgi:hypothetical protein